MLFGFMNSYACKIICHYLGLMMYLSSPGLNNWRPQNLGNVCEKDTGENVSAPKRQSCLKINKLN